MMNISGIILAGGLSSRMGQDKGLLEYKGRALIEYSIDALKPLCTEIIISSNNPEYEQYGLRVIADVHEKTGPIGGLYASICEAKTDDILVCPCDMPFITPDVFRKILDEKADSVAAIIKSSSDKLYPTLGYYNKSCLPLILQQIEHQNYKLQWLLKELKAKAISIADPKQLLNFNYPEDIQ
ncbi:molybdenum cofactor guanylyltransferase [Carboxylicivirga sp. RSCT41]|uniref:molybdenum cofactor guanylyltransferase n=1 Tax=Carboxylicivirga agarovorans TaxID=3417570 RepID=UPI003D33398B